MTSNGLILGLTSGLAFGLLDIVISVVSRSVGAIRSLIFAQIVSASILLIMLINVFTAGISLPMLGTLLLVGGGLGIVNTFANINLYKGLQIGPVSVVSSVSATYGLVTALLSTIFLHEGITLFQVLGIGFIMLGILFLAYESLADFARTRFFPGPAVQFVQVEKLFWQPMYYKGLWFGVGSMIGFGFEFFGMSLATTYLGPTQPILWSRLFSILLLSIYTMRVGRSTWSKIRLKHILLLLATGLLDTVGMIWYNIGTNLSSTSIIAVLSSTYILLPTFLGALIHREHLSLVQWVGIGILVVGVVLLSLAFR